MMIGWEYVEKYGDKYVRNLIEDYECSSGSYKCHASAMLKFADPERLHGPFIDGHGLLRLYQCDGKAQFTLSLCGTDDFSLARWFWSFGEAMAEFNRLSKAEPLDVDRDFPDGVWEFTN